MNQDASGRTIRPADFQSPDGTGDQSNPKSDSPANLSLKAAGFIAVLVLVALATLLLLPGQIGGPSSELTQIAAESEAPPAPEEQPFVDAQLLRARQEAQQILAELIAAQNQLETLSVENWAAENYAEILELAASGDLAYQQRLFDQALDIYRQAEQAASELLDARAEYAQEALAAADEAFSAGDSTKAMEQYRLAQMLVPDSEAAAQGVARAAVFDQVNALKESAAQARADDDWGDVANLLEQAVDLDPLDQEAENLLAQAREEIRQILFRQALAQGFNALANADFSQAKTAFLRADQLVPGSSTVADALMQVEAAAETEGRAELFDLAQAAESEENWQLAARHYRDLLAKDDSNVEARINLIRVEARAELQSRIEDILNDPAALQSDERWNQAEATLADARAVITKTPGLVDQIGELERVIRQARTPVELHILSDGRTQIEIYRVGRLGTLTDHRVNIYPGNYVVIGRRSGYRDVRKELVIPGGAQEFTLRIEANEPIAR